MIFNHNKRELEKSGDFKSQTFGIKNAGKIFKILVDGIYSDPYGSIVREYCSNSVDATTEAKSNKNVIVKWIDKNSITGSEETLIFRDFGIGISPERMFDIFCNLGETTKDKSNDYIGAMGLGSKSAFKYTDSFTVRTIFEGTEYLYNLNLNQEGVAEANLLYSNETDEESGTEVCIPIKQGDKGNFVEAIREQLFYFPNIEYINLDIEKPIIEKDSEHYIIAKNCPESYISLKLGNVLYPINHNILNLDYTIRNKNITLKFNIGEIFPIASREQIDYTEETKKKILEKIDLVRAEYTLESLADINNETNVFKWFQKVQQFRNNYFLLNKDTYEFVFQDKLKYSFNLLTRLISIKLVTKESGRKWNSIPKIRLNSAQIDNFNFPIYGIENYSSVKTEYIYDTVGKYLTIKPIEYSEDLFKWEEEKLDQQQFEELQAWLLQNINENCDVKDYDAVEVPKEEKVKITKVKPVKLSTEISCKEFYHDGWGKDAYKFKNSNSKISWFNNRTIIYSFYEESDEFLMFITLFACYKNPEYLSNYSFIKIGKQTEKLINGVHYKKILNQEMTTDELKAILTVNYLINLPNYKYLSGLDLLRKCNPDIHKKYRILWDYESTYNTRNYYVNKELLAATVDLAFKNQLLDSYYLDLYKELEEYALDVKLLYYITSSAEVPNEILQEYLESKGKSQKQEENLNQLKLELNV